MDFIKDLNIDKVRNLAEDAFNQVKPKNDVEARVYEVLSHKNWGASTTLMNEIAQDTFDYERFLIVTKLMWEAIETPRPSAWRVIFKGLTLLEHLVKNGSERCVDDARNHSHLLRNLDRFNYYEGTVDRGVGVREKSKQIVDILQDDERIREERQKARQLREKFAGRGAVASNSGGGGGGGSGGGGGVKYAGYGNSDANWASSTSGNRGGSSGGGYGDGGIGSSSSGRVTGRYGEGGVDSAPAPKSSSKKSSKSTSSSGGATKVKKPKKKEKKVVAPAPAAPEVDLFSFDTPASAPVASGGDDFDAFQTAGPAPVSPVGLAKPPAAAPAAAAVDDFGDFQQIAPTSAVQFDAFNSAPAPAQQQQGFDAFGAAPSMMQQPQMQQPTNNGGGMGMMNNAFGNMSLQGANTMAAPAMNTMAAAAADNDDFGDFEDAPNSSFTSPTSPVATSSDPMSKLISLDGLSKNVKKEKPQNKPIDFSQPLGGSAGIGGANGGNMGGGGMGGGGFQPQPIMGKGQQGDVGEVFGQLMTQQQQQQAQQQKLQQQQRQQQQMGMGGMNQGMSMGMNPQMGGGMGGMGGQQQQGMMNNTMMGGGNMGGGMGGQQGGMMGGGNMGMMGGQQGMMGGNMQGNVGMGGQQQSGMMGGNNMGMMGGGQGQMNNNMMGGQMGNNNMMGGNNMGMMGGQGFR